MEYNRSKYLFKNIGILTISNFTSKVLVFVLVPLYTSVLTTEEYGVYDIVYSSIQLMYPILTLNIADAIMRFTMDKEKSINETVNIGIKFFIIGVVPAIILFLISSKFYKSPLISGFEILISLYYLFYCSNQFAIQLAKGTERIIDMGIAGVLGTLFLLFGNIFFMLIVHRGLTGFYIANVLAQAIPSLFLFIRIKIWKYKFCLFVNKELQREMLLYCMPLIVTSVGWWVNNSADKYTVLFFCGAAANGLLSVSYKIPAIVNVLQTIFIQAWQISAIKEYGSNDMPIIYGRSFKYLNMLFVIICSLLILLTKPIAYIMYQKEFFWAWQYVPFLIVSCIFNFSSGFLGPILSAKKNSRVMAISAVYGTLTNIIMNIGLVYLIGIQGATIATALSSLIIYYHRLKAVGADMIVEHIRDIYISWIFICVQAIVEIYTQAWWVEIIILLILVILSRKTLKNFIGLIFRIIQ